MNPLVYTAQSKHYFYCRDAVCEFVFRRGGVPLNPFRAFDYFLSDRVPRDQIREANQRLIAACDEVWVFGDQLADGVLIELAQATRLGRRVRFFTIDPSAEAIEEIDAVHLTVEDEVVVLTGMAETDIRSQLTNGGTERLAVALGRQDEVSNNF